MTQYYLGANRGQSVNMQSGKITTGTSTGSTDMELRWDSTKGLTKLDLRQFTEMIEYAIETNTLQSVLPPL